MQTIKRKSHRSSPRSLAETKNAAVALLDANDLSRTRSRLEILKLFLTQDCIASAEDVFSTVKKFGFDLTTVYRTLQTFEDSNIVSRVQLADGVARFELKNSDGHHHHHIICRSCKKIEIIEDCIGEKLNKIGQKLGFSNVEHSLEFYGLCPKCEAK